MQSDSLPAIKKEEIDLVDIATKIWRQRKIIIITVSIFCIVGLITSLTTPNEYQSEVTLVVESNNNSGGMTGLLQQFSGLAGLNVDAVAGEDALKTELYPDIIKSTPFLLELLNQRVIDSKDGSTLSLTQYIDERTRSSFVSNIFKFPKELLRFLKKKNKEAEVSQRSASDEILFISLSQSINIEKLKKRITTKEGKSPNVLIINVEMQDPLVVAQVADSLVKNLTKYIIEYRTQKSKNDLIFISARHKEAEDNFLKASDALAKYKDRNKNLISSEAQIEGDRLQANFNLAFNVYNTLAQQLEQAKIKVQDKTPVFKILEPSKMPLLKSRPKTIQNFIIMFFLGMIVGTGIVLGKGAFSFLRNG